MSICEPALKTKCIPICTQELRIGLIETGDIDVNVFIKDITTGRIEMFQTTSDNSGVVLIDISEHTFSDNHTYEIWATLSDQPVESKLAITIEDESSLSVALCFLDITTTDGPYVFTSTFLELA